jgi:hypothetical protein
MLISTFLLGALEAEGALTPQAANYELSLKTGDGFRANLLKVTSDALVVMQTPNEISVVPRSEVKMLKRLDVPAMRPAAWFGAYLDYYWYAWQRLKSLLE